MRKVLFAVTAWQFIANQMPLGYSCLVNPLEQVYRIRYVDRLIRAGENDKALRQARVLAFLHPNDPMAINMLSLAEAASGHREAAGNNLARFIRLDPLFYRSN